MTYEEEEVRKASVHEPAPGSESTEPIPEIKEKDAEKEIPGTAEEPSVTEPKEVKA